MLLTALSCTDTEFRCQYVYQCVDLAKVDDGLEDCLDHSDEGLPLRVYDSPLDIHPTDIVSLDIYLHGYVYLNVNKLFNPILTVKPNPDPNGKLIP